MQEFESLRGEEYTNILEIRAGQEPESVFLEETKQHRKKILELFGNEWASSHNQYALLSIFHRIAVECGDEELRQDLRIFKDGINEYVRPYLLSYAFKIFKIAWINYKEILPKENNK